MRIGILTKEFPPYIYGGAGIHVAALVKEFSKHNFVDVKCFGDQNIKLKNLSVKGYAGWEKILKPDEKKFMSILEAQSIALKMVKTKPQVDIIHSHTWYTAYAGFLMKKLYGLPLVLTMHSLEPLRPWKRDQLGAAYDVSCWMEKLAVENADRIIAVSDDMKINILRCYNISPHKVDVIYNGIDAHRFSKTNSTAFLKQTTINYTKPYILFVGRITRQKGLIYLLQALKHINKDVELVICAGAPDEQIIYQQIKNYIKRLKHAGRKITHIEEFVDKEKLQELYSHAGVFVCPSIYEPFGIINLEAMACETPVVASAVGGIPEIVIPDETGLLVAFKSISEINHAPRNPKNYSYRLAKSIQFLLDNPKTAKQMGVRGRKIAMKNFTWKKIANQTVQIYHKVISKK
ncbi:MAG: glycogen synthase [Patescibacteria group bacterium]